MQGFFKVTGHPGAMLKTTSSDAAQALPTSLTMRSDRQPAIAVTITTENQDIRVSWDGTDPSTTVGHVMYAGQSLRLENIEAIRFFKFISKTAGNHAILHVSPEYPTSLSGAF